MPFIPDALDCAANVNHGEAYRAMCLVAYDRVKFGIISAKDSRAALEQLTPIEMAGHLLSAFTDPKLAIRFLLVIGHSYDRWAPDLQAMIERCCDDNCATCHGTGVVHDETAPVDWRSCLACLPSGSLDGH
jgi:hypothetical protein